MDQLNTKSAGVDTIREATIVEKFIESVKSINTEMQFAVGRLKQHNDKWLGLEPENISKEPSPPVQNAHCYTLDELLQKIEKTAKDLSHEINRYEKV